MSWKVWKSPEERAREEFDKAVSLRNQKKWGDAAEHFMKAAELFKSAGKTGDAEISLVLSSLYNAAAKQSADDLLTCSSLAKAMKPDLVLTIPQKITASDLAKEAEILGREMKLRESWTNNKSEETAKECEELAKELYSLGKDEFLLQGLIEAASESPMSKANKLMGIASLIRGEILVLSDPEKASDHLSQAMGYFRLGANEQMIKEAEKIARKSAKVGKCWFCGRIVQGEEIHFVHLNAEVTPYIKTKYGGDSPQSIEGSTVIACRACSSAIEGVSDRIAKAYYDQAVRMMMEMKEELLARIRALESEISILKGMQRAPIDLGREMRRELRGGVV